MNISELSAPLVLGLDPSSWAGQVLQDQDQGQAAPAANAEAQNTSDENCGVTYVRMTQPGSSLRPSWRGAYGGQGLNANR